MTNVVPFQPDRVEVWSGVEKGKTAKTWVVSVFMGGYECVVHDSDNEAAARDAAQGWGLPIFIVG